MPFCAPSPEAPCPAVLPFLSPPDHLFGDGDVDDVGDGDGDGDSDGDGDNDDGDLLQFSFLGANGLLEQTDLRFDLYQFRLIPGAATVFLT